MSSSDGLPDGAQATDAPTTASDTTHGCSAWTSGAPATLYDRLCSGPDLPEIALLLLQVFGLLDHARYGWEHWYLSISERSYLQAWLLLHTPTGRDSERLAHAALRHMPDAYVQLLRAACPARLASFSKTEEPSLFDKPGGH